MGGGGGAMHWTRSTHPNTSRYSAPYQASGVNETFVFLECYAA